MRTLTIAMLLLCSCTHRQNAPTCQQVYAIPQEEMDALNTYPTTDSAVGFALLGEDEL